MVSANNLNRYIYLVLFTLVSSTQLTSCALQQTQQHDPATEMGLLEASTVLGQSEVRHSQPSPAIKETDDAVNQSGSANKSVIYKGSNKFVNAGIARPVALRLDGDGLVLNFENADLREVVRTIFSDFLNVNYIYDPRVQGTVSLQTSGKLDPKDVLATLETLLRMNGAAMIADGDLYKVIPADEAPGQLVPQLGDSSIPLPPGYRVTVVPLKYTSVIQMEKILEPFAGPKTVLRVDIDRNLLVLAGSSDEINQLLQTIKLFDADWLDGMSVGLFPLENVSPDDMIKELDVILGSDADGPLAGMLRFEPINRLNALLVVTSQSRYLTKVKNWIGRLDKNTESGQNLYVYYLQNGKASDLAKILTEVFSNRKNASDSPAGKVAPGKKQIELESGSAAKKAAIVKAEKAKAKAAASLKRSAGRTSEGLAYSESADIRIIADEVNNALLILANPQDHRMVTAAISKLDIVPLQVLIEATIAEVKLTNNLSYGLQWFFKENKGKFESVLSTGTSSAIAPGYPGFSLIFADGATKVILEALDRETSVEVVSSPHLMVLDNQTAELQVGDEVPVITRQQQSSVSSDSNLVNTVEYRDTGVIMRVTPRVNISGSIIMEIEQEVSSVGNETSLTPTISQRRFKSSIVVQSGQTVVLGGLIFDSTSNNNEGLPLLSRLPLIGPLFGTRSNSKNRTELVMLITPRLIKNSVEAGRVTEEVRNRLRNLKRMHWKKASVDEVGGR